MALYKRGGIYHYDFAMDGRRYRGTTKESVPSRARMIEAKLMNEAKQRKLTARRRTLTLAEFSTRFLDWVEKTRLEPESKKYYQSGWNMLSKTPISGVRLAHITTDEAEALRFNHSPANASRALRTLRRMLGRRQSGERLQRHPESSWSKRKDAPRPSTTRRKPNFLRWPNSHCATF